MLIITCCWTLSDHNMLNNLLVAIIHSLFGRMALELITISYIQFKRWMVMQGKISIDCHLHSYLLNPTNKSCYGGVFDSFYRISIQHFDDAEGIA